MSINIGPPSVDGLKPKIAVIGVGGAGGNAIANMIAAQVEGVDFIVANTDAQALNTSPAENRIQLGPDITEGLGAGSRPEVGRAAAEETLAVIEEALSGAHMCFIAAGMGGGTGTGAAPVIAKAAREKNILTVGVVTKPFMFEGTRRMRSADQGIEELQQHVDTLIVIPNQNLFLVANPNTTFKEAFEMADDVLQQGVRGITDLMVMPGLVNLDFADVRSVMHEMGKAMMGTGEAEGDDRALLAAEAAIANPLLDGVSMQGARGVIISITGGEDMRLMEVDQAASHIRELVDPDANIIWGSAFNADLDGKIRVSVVATGIDGDEDGARSGGVQADRPFAFARSTPKPAPAPVAAAPEPEPAFETADEDADMDDFVSSASDEGTSARPGFSDETSGDGETSPESVPSFLSDSPSRGDGGSTPVFGGSAEPAEPETAQLLRVDESDDGKDGDEDGDNLLDLGTAEMLPPEGAKAEAPASSPAPSEPSAPGGFGSRKVVTPEAPPSSGHPLRSDEARAPRLQTGGPTLFERMASLSRGGARPDAAEDEKEDEEAFNIPRFLNRQNNK